MALLIIAILKVVYPAFARTNARDRVRLKMGQWVTMTGRRLGARRIDAGSSYMNVCFALSSELFSRARGRAIISASFRAVKISRRITDSRPDFSREFRHEMR